MITEKDLQEAIAECQGQRNPNANTCIKLAAFLTIKKEMFPNEQEEERGYSFAAPMETISYQSNSEFSQMIQGKEQDEVFSVIDELMDAVKVLNPRLYESVLRKLN